MARLTTKPNAQPVEVYALPTGQLSHPDRWIFEDGDEDWMKARHTYPDYSFLIRHHSGKNILFDLGLTKDPAKLPDVIKAASQWIEPTAPKDVVDLLEEGPVAPSSISAVVFSHLHFDHVGDCTLFPDARMIAGPGGRAASTPGWPKARDSPFLAAVIEHPLYEELSFDYDSEGNTARWTPLGPFERAYDFFGDGSFFLLDTPGHMAGHLGALALTGTGTGTDTGSGSSAEWVFMGGDCCHHRSLLVGSRPMSVTVGPSGTKCFHRDPDTAKKTLDKIRALEKEGEGNVLVALAHDHFLRGCMPEYPLSVNGWTGSAWKKRLDARLKESYPSLAAVGEGDV